MKEDVDILDLFLTGEDFCANRCNLRANSIYYKVPIEKADAMAGTANHINTRTDTNGNAQNPESERKSNPWNREL